ncbi:MAG: hypothetical protein ACRD2C_16560 [Acidimicrobiales bacterium]
MRRIPGTVASTLALLALTALAACAGSSRPDAATNYRTRLESVTPQVQGLDVEIVDNSYHIEVTNRTDDEIVVFGYQDEPYLRIGPDGVAENVRSPATYINRDRQGTTAVPGSADPDAEPEWATISDGNVARWHDHRTHWMGTVDPPQVQAARDERHVVIPDWVVPVRAGTTSVEVRGDLIWVPGSSTLPWWCLGVVALAGTLGLARSSAWRRGLAAAVAAVVVVDAAHAWGVASAVSGGGLEDHLAQPGAGRLVSLAGWVVGVVAIALLTRSRRSGLHAAALTGLCLAVGGGLANLDSLSRPDLLFAGPDGLARVATAASLGIGLGLLGGATWRLLIGPRQVVEDEAVPG